MTIPQHRLTNKPQDGNQLSRNTLFIVVAFLTISILIFQSYLSKSPEELKPFQQYTLIAFAISIPSLALWYFLASPYSDVRLSKVLAIFAIILIVLSSVSTLVGIGLTIWYYYYPAGIAFIIATVLSLIYLAFIVIYEPKKGNV